MELSRREANKRANREAILEAGRRVFSTIGFDVATIRDIVRESGLSTGTFYNYFPDKESVFEVLLAGLLAELRPRVRSAREAADSSEAFIKDAFAAAVDVLVADPDNLALIHNSTNALRTHLFDGPELAGVFDELRADMDAAIEAEMMPPFPADLMTAAMIGGTVEVCVLGIRSGRSPEELGDFLGRLFFGSLSGFSR